MSTIGSADVEHIAHLARLAIRDGDIAGYARDLSAILGFVEKMNEIDTTDIVPLAHPLDMPQRLRPDEVTEGNERERFQANAPAVKDGLYLVPRVIE